MTTECYGDSAAGTNKGQQPDRRAFEIRDEELRLILERLPDAVFLLDPHDPDVIWPIVYCNEAACRMHGYSWEELIGRSIHLFNAKAVNPERGEWDLARQRLMQTIRGEDIHRRKDGTLLPIEYSTSLINLNGRELVLGIDRDISKRRQAEDALREQQRAMSTLLSNLPGMAYRCRNDKQWSMEYVSDGALALTGYPPRDLLVDGPLHGAFISLIHPDDQPGVAATVEAALPERRPFQVTYRLRRRDGTVIWVWEQGCGVYDADGNVVALEGFITDVTERKRFEDQLAHDALHDALTSLPNRTLFLNRLYHTLIRLPREPQRRFAVLFLDLDHFKSINDTFGHLAGDQLLVDVARCLEATVRPGDTVARLGGDEFAILLDNLPLEDAAIRTAERIHASLQTPFTINGQEVVVSASIGIALSGSTWNSAEDMLRDADLAMYHAKLHGRSRSGIFSQDMRM